MNDTTRESVDDLLALDNQICFRLYAVSRAVQRRYRRALDELGITYPQYLVLLSMWQWYLENPSYKPTQKAISERLYLDSGTLTPLIARMIKAGWLSKKTSEEDGRAGLISLTDKALKLKEKAVAVPNSVRCLEASNVDFQHLKDSLDDILRLLPETNS